MVSAGRRALLRSAALALIVVATPVRAQPSPSGAEREFRLGYAALARGDCARAMVHFRTSFELTPRPRTVFNMAVCEADLGLLADAWRSYQRFLGLAEARDAELVLEARARLAALRPTLRGRLGVTTSPPGAAVDVDGERRPELTPVTLVLEPGPHTIRVSIAGAPPAERTVDVHPEEHATVAMVLEPPVAAAVAADDDTPEAPARPRTSRTTLHVAPLPAAVPEPTAGRQDLLTVDLQAPRSAARRRVRRGLAGLGVASLAGGGVMGVLALRDVTSADPDRHARGERRAWIADGMFVVGTATLVVAWRLLRERPAPAPVTPAWSPAP